MDQATHQKTLSFLRGQMSGMSDMAEPHTVHRDMLNRLGQYALDFLSGKKEDRFIILSGLRGSGKTTLFSQLFSELTAVPQKHKLFISLDRMKDLDLSLTDILEVYEKEILGTSFERLGDPVFLFLDEVQYDEKWMLTLKTLFDRTEKTKQVCIFVTGSAALSLQGGRVGADVARRVRYEHLFPMSFTEYIKLKYEKDFEWEKLTDSIRDAFLRSKNAEDLFACLKKLMPDVNTCLAAVDPKERGWYMKYGSLPFVLSREKEEEIHAQIYQVVQKVVKNDMLVIDNFKPGTVAKVVELLYYVAHSDKVPVKEAGNLLGLSRPVVMGVLEALGRSESLLKISSYGSVNNQTRKPSKYTFFASSVRSTLFNVLGTARGEDFCSGKLLEDVAAMYLHRIFVCTQKGWHLRYDSEKGGADFVLAHRDRDVVFEVGLGHKGVKQVYKTLKKTKPDSFGVVVSSDVLSLDERKGVVSVPLEVFLLM